MSLDKSVTEKIVEFVNTNPFETSLYTKKKDYLAWVAQECGTTWQYVRREIRRKQNEIRQIKVPKSEFYSGPPEQREYTENDGSGRWKYSGEKSISTEDAAIEFFEIDLDTYYVKGFTFKSYDVSMKVRVDSGKTDSKGNPIMVDKDIKRTNYSCSLDVQKYEKLVVEDRDPGPIIMESTGDSEMWVIIGCIHRPFHDKRLWNGFLSFLSDNKKKIHGLIINGDMLDLRSLSKYDDFLPSGLDLGIEYTDGRLAIKEIKIAAGKEYNRWKKIYTYGNHEDRFNRELLSHSKYGHTLLSPREALRLDEEKWQVITAWKEGFVTLGNKLQVFHGQYYTKQAAKAHLDAMPGYNMIFNHTHRVQSYSNGPNTAYNIGWMGNKDSDGFKYSNRFTKHAWEQAFGIAYIDQDGNDFVSIIKAINSRFFFGGKIY